MGSVDRAIGAIRIVWQTHIISMTGSIFSWWKPHLSCMCQWWCTKGHFTTAIEKYCLAADISIVLLMTLTQPHENKPRRSIAVHQDLKHVLKI